MKVKLKDIRPNPWRYINKGYPINKEKIELLRTSIKRTGFWDNLVAREKNGEIQIAYGHHRIEALRQDFSPNHEIGLIIRDLTDADMLKIMAHENETIGAMSPMVINETVRAAKDFLDSNPEEMKKLVRTSTHKHGRHITTVAIAEFLNWSENRIADALGAIHDIENGVIDKDEYEAIPFQRSAESFRSAVKKHNLPKSVRKEIVDDLKVGKIGHRGIDDAVFRYKLTNGNGKHKPISKKEIDINDVANGIIEGILRASTNMTEGFISNWLYVTKENRGKILFAAESLFSKFNKIKKANTKLIEESQK